MTSHIENFRSEIEASDAPAEFKDKALAALIALTHSNTYQSFIENGGDNLYGTDYVLGQIVEAYVLGKSAVTAQGAKHDVATTILAEINAE